VKRVNLRTETKRRLLANDSIDWNARFLGIARKAKRDGSLSKLDGPMAEILHPRLQEQAEFKMRWAIIDAHGTAREAVLTGVRQILRAGALLLDARTRIPSAQFASFIAGCGLDAPTAATYMNIAARYAKLADECRRRRRGRLHPDVASVVLKALRQGKQLTTIVTLENLRAIFDLAGT